MDVEKRDMDDLIKSVIHGKPHVHIGKNGISQEVIRQIKDQLEKKKIIKIKFLAFDEFDTFNQAVEYLKESTNARLLDVRGKSVVIRHYLF